MARLAQRSKKKMKKERFCEESWLIDQTWEKRGFLVVVSAITGTALSKVRRGFATLLGNLVTRADE